MASSNLPPRADNLGPTGFSGISRLFSGVSGPGGSDRKTVTFGDSSAVRSNTFASIVSLMLLLGLWFGSTTAWGLSQDFVDEANLAEADKGENDLTDAELVTRCNADPDCKGSYTRWVKPTQFPSIPDTLGAFVELNDEGFRNVTLGSHTRTSLWRVARGMFWGTLVGVPIGAAMGLSSLLRGFFDTPVEIFRPIPPLALIPLAIAFFGLGDDAAVPLLVFASIWIMIIAARSGAQAVSLSKVRAAYSLGASKRQVLTRVILPNALPDLFTGVRVALGVSWGTLVAAELVGASEGLGSMIFAARQFFRTDVMVVGIVTIAVLGVLMDVILRFLESKLIPWRGKG